MSAPRFVTFDCADINSHDIEREQSVLFAINASRVRLVDDADDMAGRCRLFIDFPDDDWYVNSEDVPFIRVMGTLEEVVAKLNGAG